jgi:hypothetical protein
LRLEPSAAGPPVDGTDYCSVETFASRVDVIQVWANQMPDASIIYQPWQDRLVVLPFAAITQNLGSDASRHRNVLLEVRIDCDSVGH